MKKGPRKDNRDKRKEPKKDYRNNPNRGNSHHEVESNYAQKYDVSTPQRITPEVIKPKNTNQKLYWEALNNRKVRCIIATGSAGTGKTFLCASHAIDELVAGYYSKLIITRPIVEAGENLGFLPGDQDEKVAPYFAPVLNVFKKRVAGGELSYLLKKKNIDFIPLAFMRGHDFANSIVILDEAQNASPEQIYLLLTRMGNHSKLIINGDIAQKDIQKSGLERINNTFRNVNGIVYVNFTNDDIVRSKFVKDVIIAWEKSS